MVSFRGLVTAALLLSAPLSRAASAETGPVRLSDPSAAPELVWSHAASACFDTDFADVPVRPFFGRVPGAAGLRLFWSASASTDNGYLATVGEPPVAGADILARFARVHAPDGHCRVWFDPGPYSEPPVQPANGVPASYNTGLWMEAPFTPDGRHVYALVHNEFHGERTAPPGHPSPYCTLTEFATPPQQACSYWNVVGATSGDGGRTFAMQKLTPTSPFNAPVIALPYPYVLPAQNGGSNPPQAGMTMLTNIVQWGRYYYVLVQQRPSAAPSQSSSAFQPIGIDGVCLYRTDDLADRHAWRGWDGRAYTVPVIDRYPAHLPDPARYTCTTVLSGKYRSSWSYNTVLHQFIIVGVDTRFNGSDTEAFVYTTATLDCDGRLTQTSGEHLLRTITWIDRWGESPTVTGEAYPSLLDPTSPSIRADGTPNRTPGDLNFQYSGAHPFLYYTRLNPWKSSPHRTDRDVVREPLLVTLSQ